jgi:hypothetical protein
MEAKRMSNYKDRYEKNRPNMKRIVNWLNAVYGGDDYGSSCGQGNNKVDLFNIFRDIYSEDMPNGEMIKDFLKDNWKSHPKRVEEEIRDVFSAWDEWRYAISNYPIVPSSVVY